jgi:hypothetical protein
LRYQNFSYFCYVFRSIIDNRKKYPNVVVGYNAWRDYVLSFGVGVKIHTDLPQELPGNVPTQKYYDKYFGKNGWKSSTIVSLSIGQGELGVTPLQMANIICSIANKGYYYTPHIVKGIGDKKKPRDEYKIKHYTKVESQYFEPIIDGMQGAVDHGTSTAAKLKDIKKLNITNDSIINFSPKKKYDLVLVKGLLIHLNPNKLKKVYKTIYKSCKPSGYILIAEYYSPKPTMVIYRGESNKLFKRDFAGEFVSLFKKTKILKYGFSYHKDKYPQDDLNWFLIKKYG